MLNGINIMLLEKHYSSVVETKRIHKNIIFNCTNNPLQVIEAVVKNNIQFIVMSDDVDSLDVLGFVSLVQSISPDVYIPIYLKSSDSSEAYLNQMLEAGFVDILPASMKIQEIYMRLSIMFESHANTTTNLFNTTAPLPQPQNSGLITDLNDDLNNSQYFDLQQPLPKIDSVPSYDYNIVKQAISIIKEDHARNLSLEQLVDGLDINRNALSNAFMRIYKCSIFAWIREEKLLISKLLVSNRIGNITQISARLGYSDAAHFSRSFKQRFGCSPKKLNDTRQVC
mgnify:CR=1 FL=1